MKAFLMHRDRDFDLAGELPANADALEQDLELAVLYSGMGAGDGFISEVGKTSAATQPARSRRDRLPAAVLTECLEQPTVVRELYALAGEALQA